MIDNCDEKSVNVHVDFAECIYVSFSTVISAKLQVLKIIQMLEKLKTIYLIVQLFLYAIYNKLV